MTLRPWPVRRALGWLYMVSGVLDLANPYIWKSWLTVKVYTSAQSLINWYTSRAHGYGRPGKLRELLYVHLNCLCAIHYSITLDHVVMDYTTLLLYLRSSTWTHSCYSPHTSGEVLGLWSTSQFGSSGVKFALGDQSCLSVDYFLRLSLLLSSLYIKHYEMILPLYL